MQRHLADGLILRTLSEGVASDREQLPDFYADVNGEGDPEESQQMLRIWTRDLIKRHPTTTLDDIFVVVDPAQDDRIASATLLIPQRWCYEEIPIAVGRPELVGTRPGYRGRGLVRTLFNNVHERSAKLGHQLQAITGIPHFYRQFGYTMALDLGYPTVCPLYERSEPLPDYKPAFTLRPATVDDIPNIMEWHDYMARERLVTLSRSMEEWRYDLMGHSAGSDVCMDYQIIVNAANEGVGYLELFANRPEPYRITCSAYVVGDRASYLESFGDVMRGIRQWAVAKFGECPALMGLTEGIHESLERLIERKLGSNTTRQPNKWYLRVPDPIPFLRHIQPVLERRLEGSGAHRYTGELRIGFYDLTGIALKFEHGCITEISDVKGKDGYDISFPWNLFWNVVIGHHTIDEINTILPEVGTGGKGAVLIDTLFPKKKSWVRGLA